MRNDLKAIEGITEVSTDVDEKTVTFFAAETLNVEAALNELVESNDKLKDWEFIR